MNIVKVLGGLVVGTSVCLQTHEFYDLVYGTIIRTIDYVSIQLTIDVQNSRHECGNVRHHGASDIRRAQHLCPSDLLLEEHSDKRITLRFGVKIDRIALITWLDELREIGRDRDCGDGLNHEAVRLSCRADRSERCVRIGIGDTCAGRRDWLDVKRGSGQVVKLRADADTDRLCHADGAEAFSVECIGTTRQERGHVQ